jgi:hypothetical protein
MTGLQNGAGHTLTDRNGIAPAEPLARNCRIENQCVPRGHRYDRSLVRRNNLKEPFENQLLEFSGIVYLVDFRAELQENAHILNHAIKL